MIELIAFFAAPLGMLYLMNVPVFPVSSRSKR